MAIVDAHNKEIKEENFTEIEYKKDRKNHIAIRLITTGLSTSDRRKVLACRTAKEKWDELEKIYRKPDVPVQISSTSDADVPPKEKGAMLCRWERSEFNETLQQRKILCLMAKEKVKIIHFLAKSELPICFMVNTHGWTKLVSKLIFSNHLILTLGEKEVS